jgi:hypothetical protein
MPTYRAHYFEDGEERSARFSLSPGESCLLRLEAAQGSQAIYVVITEEADGRSRPRLRAEVEAEPGERVEVKVSLHPASDGGEPWLSLASENKRCLILKPDHQYSPLPPLVPRRDSRELDVAVVIDGTVRIWDEDAAQLNLLLDQRDAWLEHVVQLTALLEELMESYRDVHAAVYAFGDHLFSELGDPDLKPSYLLDPPEGHRLRVSQAEELQQRMMDLRSSPGGDFVDALGEALSVACTLAWRPNARKILPLAAHRRWPRARRRRRHGRSAAALRGRGDRQHLPRRAHGLGSARGPRGATAAGGTGSIPASGQPHWLRGAALRAGRG